MATRDELILAVGERYGRARLAEKRRILDEFVAVTGYHRKHAMRLLRGGQRVGRSGPRPERRVYDEAVREALIVVWEASDRICGKRLRPLLPVLVEAMERHGHLRLAPEVRISLLTNRQQGGRVVAPRLPPRSAAACRCAPSRIGRIRHPGSSRRIWWRIAVRSRAAVSCRRWC